MASKNSNFALITLVFAALLFAISTSAYSMESLASFLDNNGDETDKVDELSPCGKIITEFKFFMKDGKRCVRDTDCTALKGACPIGCKFYANKTFEAILEKRIKQSEKTCSYISCSSVCPPKEEWPQATCEDNICVAKN